MITFVNFIDEFYLDCNEIMSLGNSAFFYPEHARRKGYLLLEAVYALHFQIFCGTHHIIMERANSFQFSHYTLGGEKNHKYQSHKVVKNIL